MFLSPVSCPLNSRVIVNACCGKYTCWGCLNLCLTFSGVLNVTDWLALFHARTGCNLNIPFADLLVGIVWGLALCFTLAGSLICSVLCICLAGKPRAIAIDCLLWLATLVIVAFNSASFLPQSLLKGKAADSFQLSYQRKADLLSLDIESVLYANRLESPWINLAQWEGLWTPQKALKKAEQVLQDIRKDHGDDPLIASRLAIVIHESGGQVQKEVFEKYAAKDRDPLMSFLEQLYSSGSQGLPKTALPVEAIKDRLPEGWYRNAVLKEYYQRTSNSAALEQLKQEENRLADRWISRYKALEIAVGSCLLLGLVAVVRFFRSPGPAGLPEPANYGFRKIYGCMLSCLYAGCLTSILTAFGIGLWSGYRAVVNHTNVVYPDSTAIITPLVVVAGALSASLCFYLFICRPARLSVRKALLDERQVRGAGASALYCFLGFCTAMLSSTLNGLICSKLGAESKTSEAVSQMVNAFVTTNLAAFLWSCCWFCILAPFTEELLVRVLLYPWLRHRLGVPAGVILSSAIFAAGHFNFNYFFHYFAIGAILAIVYERTRSFPIIVGIHALWNGWTILAVSSLIPR
jgi:membrane protease YdiL (CAAX protease family)